MAPRLMPSADLCTNPCTLVCSHAFLVMPHTAPQPYNRTKNASTTAVQRQQHECFFMQLWHSHACTINFS